MTKTQKETIYFALYKVSPLPANDKKVAGANAAFWIKAENHHEAAWKAEEHLHNNHWQIDSVEISATPTTHEQQLHGQAGERCFLHAQETGFAVAIAAWEKA